MSGDGLKLVLGLAPDSPVLIVGPEAERWREVFPGSTACRRFPGQEFLAGPFGLIVYHSAVAADAHAVRRDLAGAFALLAENGSLLVLAENAASFRNLKRFIRGEWAVFNGKLFRATRRCEKALQNRGIHGISRFFALPSLERPEELVALGSPLLELPHYWHPVLHAAKKLGLYRYLAEGVVLVAGSSPLERSGVARLIIDAVSRLSDEGSGQWAVERMDIRKRGAVVLFLAEGRSGRGIIARVVSDSGINAIISKNHRFLEALTANPALAPKFRELLPCPLCRLDCSGATVYVETMLRGIPAWKVNRGRLRDDVFRNALEFLMELGRATGKRIRLENDSLDELFGVDLALVEHSSVIAPDFREELMLLVRQLKCSLGGREVLMTASHGDYGYGNILVDQHSGAMKGVIDWDTGRTSDFPGIDLFNLLVQQERSAGNCGAQAAFSRVVHGIVSGGYRQNQHLLRCLGELGIEEDMVNQALSMSFLRYVTRALQYPDLFLEEQEDFRSILGLLGEALPL